MCKSKKKKKHLNSQYKMGKKIIIERVKEKLINVCNMRLKQWIINNCTIPKCKARETSTKGGWWGGVRARVKWSPPLSMQIENCEMRNDKLCALWKWQSLFKRFVRSFVCLFVLFALFMFFCFCLLFNWCAAFEFGLNWAVQQRSLHIQVLAATYFLYNSLTALSLSQQD